MAIGWRIPVMSMSVFDKEFLHALVYGLWMFCWGIVTGWALTVILRWS